MRQISPAYAEVMTPCLEDNVVFTQTYVETPLKSFDMRIFCGCKTVAHKGLFIYYISKTGTLRNIMLIQSKLTMSLCHAILCASVNSILG